MDVRNGRVLIYNGTTISGSSEVTGSLSVTGGITGSLSGTASVALNATSRSFGAVFDGGGSTIEASSSVDVIIPTPMTITSWTMISDVTGSAVIDIWKDTYANYPPTVVDSITGTAKPTITSADKAQSSTLTEWTSSLSAGDILRFNVDSCTSITKLTISIQATAL